MRGMHLVCVCNASKFEVTGCCTEQKDYRFIFENMICCREVTDVQTAQTESALNLLNYFRLMILMWKTV
jgi:hypothetical protein